MTEKQMKIKTNDIKQLIEERYSRIKNGKAVKWVVLSEIRTNTGFRSKRVDGEPFAEKYIDMMAFNCWPSEGFTRVAFEIKTSRSDFLNELKKPEKRWLAMMYSHKFFFVTPKKVATMFDVPPSCGLIHVVEVDGKLKLHTARAAPRREASPMPDSFIASLLRRACKMTENKEEK